MGQEERTRRGTFYKEVLARMGEEDGDEDGCAPPPYNLPACRDSRVCEMRGHFKPRFALKISRRLLERALVWVSYELCPCHTRTL